MLTLILCDFIRYMLVFTKKLPRFVSNVIFMKKALWITSSILITQIALIAQTITPEVISSGGGVFSNSNYSISYTIGELITPTVETSSTIITQGFQQPEEMFVSVPEKNTQVNLYRVFPNPFSNDLKISFLSSNYDVEVVVYDILGQAIGFPLYLQGTGNQPEILNTAHLKSGVYIIQVIDRTGKGTAEFKLTKL